MASRTPTSVNQVPPGTEMLVTPERSTFCTLRADLSVENSGRVVPLPLPSPLIIGIAVGHVAVRVDQARHDPLPAGVDHLDVSAVVELDVGRQRADALDPVAFDDDGIVADRGLPEPSISVPLRITSVFLLAALMTISLLRGCSSGNGTSNGAPM